MTSMGVLILLVNTDSLKNQMERQQQVKSGQFFDPANPIQQCGSVNIHQLGSMEQCPFVGQIAEKSLLQHTVPDHKHEESPVPDDTENVSGNVCLHAEE